jgi:hypothetical protein
MEPYCLKGNAQYLGEGLSLTSSQQHEHEKEK